MDDSEHDDSNDLSNIMLYNRDARFQDLRAAEAEAFNGILTRHLPSEVRDWTCDLDGWTFELEDLALEIHNDASIPIRVKAESDTMVRRFLDPLRVDLRDLVSESFELYFNSTGFAVLLLQLAEKCVVWLDLWKKHIFRLAHPKTPNKAPGLLRMSDIQLDGLGLNIVRLDDDDIKRLTARHNAVAPRPYTLDEITGWYSVCDNSSGLDISSVEDNTQHILGKSIQEICKEITHPKWFEGERIINDDIRILHIEPIFRHDLVLPFLERKRQIHEDLLQMSHGQLRKCVSDETIPHGSPEDTVEGLAQVLSEPFVTFHGAPKHVIESIVRYGFVVPGRDIGKTGVPLEIACGASFGVGVYSTPDPYYAMWYGQWSNGVHGAEGSGAFRACHARGQKIIVCATLMGRAATIKRKEARGREGLLCERTHSHVSPCQREYTVFDSAQIVPCYVLHIADHPDLVKERFMRRHTDVKLDQATLRDPAYNEDPKDYDRHGNEIKWPAYEEKKKRAIKAGAAKHFPFGFGPATGANFVIEDVADVSDDEEVYGEIQKERSEHGSEVREKHGPPETNWLDEYQLVRKKNSEVRCKQ